MINWKLGTSGCRPIGLDIGHSSVKMIQLAMHGGHVSVAAADKVRIDIDADDDAQERRDFVVSAIKRMLADGRFRGKNVVSSLPNDKLKITSLRLADAETDGIEQVLRKEAVQRFGMNPDKDVINYMHAGNVQQGDEIKNEFILFAADDEAIRNHIELIEMSGLKPLSIDTIPCALFRSFERSLRRQEDRERTVVFVDVGSRFTTVVFGRGGGISFVKQIQVGGDNFNRDVAAKLGVSVSEAEMLRGALRIERSNSMPPVGGGRVLCASNPSSAEQDGQPVALPVSQNEVSLDASTRQVIVDAVGSIAEELAREISLCFRYYTVTFRGRRVERTFLTGGEAYENILLNVLKRQLAVEIEVAQPLRGFDMMQVEFDGCKRGLLSEWAVAVGLSLKGWDWGYKRGKEYFKPADEERESDSAAELSAAGVTEDSYEGN